MEIYTGIGEKVMMKFMDAINMADKENRDHIMELERKIEQLIIERDKWMNLVLKGVAQSDKNMVNLICSLSEKKE